jgi:hypothetical protein
VALDFWSKHIIDSLSMITDYLDKKLKTAKHKVLDDKTYFGEIPGIKGVWANAKKLEDCRNELAEVLEEWLILQIKAKKSVSGFRFNFDKKALLKNT